MRTYTDETHTIRLAVAVLVKSKITKYVPEIRGPGPLNVIAVKKLLSSYCYL